MSANAVIVRKSRRTFGTHESKARQIVHRKGVTHYTLQARRVKRSTDKIARTPFVIFSEGVAPCVSS